MSTFSKGQTVKMSFLSEDLRSGRKSRSEAVGEVIYADDLVTLVRGPWGYDSKHHYVFLAPDWKDDRSQLWRIDGVTTEPIGFKNLPTSCE